MDMKILIVCIVVIIKGLRVGNWLIVVDLGFLFKGLGKAESFGGFFVLEGIWEIIDIVTLVVLLILQIDLPSCDCSDFTREREGLIILRKCWLSFDTWS